MLKGTQLMAVGEKKILNDTAFTPLPPLRNRNVIYNFYIFTELS